MDAVQDYEQIHDRYTSRALPIIENHRTQVQRIKDQEPSIELDYEQEITKRQDQYIREVWTGIDDQWGQAASDFVGEVVRLRTSLEEEVYGGDRSATGHLAALASVSDDRLEQLMNTAGAAGDEGLRRAAMLTARERGLRDVVNRYIDSDPKRKAAYEKLIRIPENERLEDIAKGYKPPRASTESLLPNEDARERARARWQEAQRDRTQFFGGGRR